MSEEHRSEERHELSHPVRVRCETWSQFLKVYTENISLGGLFLCVEEIPPVDTKLEIQIGLPDGDTLALSARVVHVVPPEKAADESIASGFGVEFVDVSDEQIRFIRSLVETAKKHEAAPPPELPDGKR